jgi:hypothetical protein
MPSQWQQTQNNALQQYLQAIQSGAIQPISSTNGNEWQRTQAGGLQNYTNDIQSGRIQPYTATTGGNSGVPINASSGTPFDFSQIYEQANKTYSPSAISSYFDTARGGLNRAAANAGSLASRTAGANSTNMLNPSGFIMSQLSQSQAPYAAQQGNLAVSQAGAIQSGQEKLTNLLYMINRAKQGDQDAAQQLKLAYDTGAEQRRQFESNQDANSAGIWDYIFGGANVTGNLFSSGIFGG